MSDGARRDGSIDVKRRKVNVQKGVKSRNYLKMKHRFCFKIQVILTKRERIIAGIKSGILSVGVWQDSGRKYW